MPLEMLKQFLAATATSAAMIAPALTASAADETPRPSRQEWSFDGVFGTYDLASAQRGFQVYKEVCSACHPVKHLHFRDLADIGYSEYEVKAIASTYQVTNGQPNDQGEMFQRPGRPSDPIPGPFPNDQAARAANNGALPPDLSMIVKARKGGHDYVYALLNGYREPPAGFNLLSGMHYNEYFPGHQIAMPPPLIDSAVSFADGTSATVSQMAHDATTFLTWAAEPTLEVRHRTGFKVILFLIVAVGVFYVAKRKIWARVTDAPSNWFRDRWAPLLGRYGFDLPEVREPSTLPDDLPIKDKWFGKTRAEAFSDGVFAVALTLLIVDLSTLALPHKFSDGEAWHEFWPKFLAWLYSTASVGMYWVAHHNEMEHVESLDRVMLWINLLFLCLIVLFPFSGVMLGIYWHADKLPEVSPLLQGALKRVPVLVYGGNLVLAGLVLRWLWSYAARPDKYCRPRFLKYNKVSDDGVLRTKRRNKLIFEVGIIVIAVGVFCPTAGQWLIITVPAIYIITSIWYAVQMKHLPKSSRIASLGIVGQDVSHELARENRVRIQSIVPGSVASVARLQPGDIVIAVDDIAVGDVDELHWQMTKKRVGEPVRITVQHDAQVFEIRVILLDPTSTVPQKSNEGTTGYGADFLC